MTINQLKKNNKGHVIVDDQTLTWSDLMRHTCVHRENKKIDEFWKWAINIRGEERRERDRDS